VEKMIGTKKRVILIGLKPEVVDYSNFPDLTPEKMMAKLYSCGSNHRLVGHIGL
jgi:hypothetical protein